MHVRRYYHAKAIRTHTLKTFKTPKGVFGSKRLDFRSQKLWRSCCAQTLAQLDTTLVAPYTQLVIQREVSHDNFINITDNLNAREAQRVFKDVINNLMEDFD